MAARTVAAYIDLNPLRAGMVEDPAAYRWSSYGEAVGGGRTGHGKRARAGLVRACLSEHGAGFDEERWQEASTIYRQVLGLALGRQPGRAGVRAADEVTLREIGMAAMLRHRVRYFSDGAVIGSKAVVNEAFAAARERFGAKRRDGARRLRGRGSPAAGVLWSLRDLRAGI